MNVVPLDKSHYWKTFNKSEKNFFWFFHVVMYALTFFLIQIIFYAFKG